MLREGALLARPHSLWCPACFDVATEEPGQGAHLAPNSGYKAYTFKRAENPFYEWSDMSCRAKKGSTASSPDVRAWALGHALAPGLVAGGG